MRIKPNMFTKIIIIKKKVLNIVIKDENVINIEDRNDLFI